MGVPAKGFCGSSFSSSGMLQHYRVEWRTPRVLCSPYDESVSAVRLLDIRDAPLSLDEVYAAVSDPAAGGICVFVGTVRDHDEGKQVSTLGYSSHPTAL